MKALRRTLAVIMSLLITVFLLDFTGATHAYLGWLAQIQFIPAVLAINLIGIAFLVLLTLLFGRWYCAVICPTGILQDFFSFFGKRKKKLPFKYCKPNNILRYSLLGLYALAIIFGVAAGITLLDPYGIYGRITNAIFSPVYNAGNNLLAYFAERADSYTFYDKATYLKSLPVLIVAIVSLVVLFIMSFNTGRRYCNTICPVGTLLGVFSRFSLFKIRIDEDKCIKCGICARHCKAECIDTKTGDIDHSRCTACMNCISTCDHSALFYGLKKKATAPAPKTTETTESSARRAFLAAGGLLVASAVEAQVIEKAKDIKVDGGLADITPKECPNRNTPIVPPGSTSLKHMKNNCVGCQACVTACPNDVLRASSSLSSFLQPQMGFEYGYCRPECTACGDACPTSAIAPFTKAEKTAIQLGHAVWTRDLCIPITKDERCGNCGRHCPTGAIIMVKLNPDNEKSPAIPTVDESRCIGCGACEYVCPVRPISAIHVEGYLEHQTI